MGSSSTKRIILVTPSIMIAEGLKSILKDSNNFKIDNILLNISDENENILKNSNADILIIDLSILDYTARMDCKSYLSEITDASLIALQTVPVNNFIEKQFEEIIDIYDTPSSILKKLHSVGKQGGKTKKSGLNDLSKREKEVLVYVAQGMLNKEIAYKLSISIYTVITHRKNITRKTGIKTVAGLTVYALLNNLIDPMSIE